ESGKNGGGHPHRDSKWASNTPRPRAGRSRRLSRQNRQCLSSTSNIPPTPSITQARQNRQYRLLPQPPTAASAEIPAKTATLLLFPMLGKSEEGLICGTIPK